MSDTSSSGPQQEETPPAAPEEPKQSPWEVRKKQIVGFLRTRHLANWQAAIGVGVGVVCGLIFALALTGVTPNKPASPATATVQPQAFLGRPLTSDVTHNQDRTDVVRQDAHFKEDTGTPQLSDTLNTIIRALSERQNLENWRLCSLELEAQAAAIKGQLRAYLSYPNAQYDYRPPLDLDVDRIVIWHRYAEALLDAAGRAAEWHLPCTDDSNVAVAWQLEFRITTVNGYEEDIILSDYDVLVGVLPLEAYKVLQKCEGDVRNELREWEKTDPKKRQRSGYGDELKAEMTMLKWANLPHC